MSSSHSDRIDAGTTFLKAYTSDGGLYILDEWKIDSTYVTGWGRYRDPYRSASKDTQQTIARDKIILFESNVLEPTAAASGLGIVLAAHALMTLYCIANPKACFGSCPTFYADNGTEKVLMAEGFSASILPSREAEDIDALPLVKPYRGRLRLTMKNEALETHVVRSVDILAVPHAPGERVFKTDDEVFYRSSEQLAPAVAISDRGPVTDELSRLDGSEYRSWTDSSDLARKESIDLYFNPRHRGSYGLVLGARQTFVSTYLFYQGLSYLGTEAGAYLALAEQGDPNVSNSTETLRSLLGGIEVWVEDSDGAWRRSGEAYEMGPIATDLHLVTIEGVASPRHVRLRLAKGSWRIDYAALAELQARAKPNVVHATTCEHVERQILFDSAQYDRASRIGHHNALVTQPGDVYEYTFDLPAAGENAELFLRSRGYYLEWLREDWLRDEDPIKAASLFVDPRGSLQREASRFKAMEQTLEANFWRTKISRNIQ